MSIMKDFYEQHNKPRKPRIKYKEFLVRYASDNAICFIVKLEDKKYWDQAKKYIHKKREEASRYYEYYSDVEIMEEYWKKNNIPYKIINIPENELYL